MDVRDEPNTCINFCQILLEKIPIGIEIAQLLYDDQEQPADYLLLDVNAACEKFFGISKEEISGKKATDVIPYIEPGWFLKYEQVVKTGISERFEMFSQAYNNWFDVMAVPLGDRDKFAILFTDVSKSKQMEAELEKADKNKNELISMLSHELRNPLAAITGGIGLLELTDKNEVTLKTLTTLKRQTDHLSKLIDDLLDVTRITEKNLTLQKETLELNTIIHYAIEAIKPLFDIKRINLSVRMGTRPIYVIADSIRITQCIEHILGNALKFTGENGEVTVSLKINRKSAEVSIQDNGIGIRPEMLEKVFEPYTQDSESSNLYDNRGLGLGLSIVKNIMEMHGGDVSVSSAGLGRGSLFILRLPIL